MAKLRQRIALGSAASLLSLAPAAALAACPNEPPGDPICEPRVVMLLPTLTAVGYFPMNAGGPYVGGGVDIGFLAWTSNNESLGPSHGRFYGGAAVLTSVQEKRRAVHFRLGADVSFERNASRRFLIPHFGVAIGGLWETQLRTRAAVDASLGLYLVHLRSFVLDAQGGVLLPFSLVDQLFGPRTQLTASFALW